MCVVAKTIIDSARIHGVTERYYDGDVVTIVTGRGRVTVTPNHPISTMDGLVAAQYVNTGDMVEIATVGAGHLASLVPIQARATVNAISGSRESFHGDGQDRVVSIHEFVEPVDTPESDSIRKDQWSSVRQIWTDHHRGKVYTLLTETGDYVAGGLVIAQ